MPIALALVFLGLLYRVVRTRGPSARLHAPHTACTVPIFYSVALTYAQRRAHNVHQRIGSCVTWIRLLIKLGRQLLPVEWVIGGTLATSCPLHTDCLPIRTLATSPSGPLTITVVLAVQDS